jgi:hypothetical protein
MRNFGRSLALMMASGLWAASAGAAVNLGNVTTRPILIETEDSTCENLGTVDAAFYPTRGNADCTSAGKALESAANPDGSVVSECTGDGTGTLVNGTGALTAAFCTGAGAPEACCTAAGTGTCYPRESFALQPAAYYNAASNVRGPYLSPDFQAPPAACTTFAADAGATFTDTTNDFYGVLTFNGGTSWTISVPERVWGLALNTTLQDTPGTSFRQTTALAIDFDAATGVVVPDVAPNYYIAYSGFAGPPALNLTLEGQENTPDDDKPFFGTGYQVGNTAPLTHSCQGSWALDFPSGSGVASAVPPFPSSETAVSFGPGVPWAVPALCGTNAGAPATPLTGMIAQPGFATGATTTLTALSKSLVLLSATLGAVDPAWAPIDVRLDETVDTDLDGIPDAFDHPEDTDGDGFPNGGNAACTGLGVAGSATALCCSGVGVGTCGTADNCPYAINPGLEVYPPTVPPTFLPQLDSGKLNFPAGSGTTPDGIGDACQCGDIDNNGQITAADVTQLRRALGGLSPLNSVGGLIYGQAAPGQAIPNKCNVGAATVGTALEECTAADATVISRNLGGLTPAIIQGCKATKATLP